MVNLDSMLANINKKYEIIAGVCIDPKELVFEERVKMSCTSCGKYYSNWKCPGNLPKDIDYKKMVLEYENGAFIYLNMPFSTENYSEIRKESSIILHKALLDIEKYLWDNDVSLVASFIGGSCKLCKNGCGETKCNNPYKSRSPVEALGINVVKSAEKYGIRVVFPPKEAMMRIGLLLW